MLIKCKECGKELSDKADICPNCGIKNNINQGTTIGLKIICFIIPIIGFIIFAVNILNKPKYAKQCLISSILSIIIILLLTIIILVLNKETMGVIYRDKSLQQNKIYNQKDLEDDLLANAEKYFMEYFD